jgi:hypothetical protein
MQTWRLATSSLPARILGATPVRRRWRRAFEFMAAAFQGSRRDRS